MTAAPTSRPALAPWHRLPRRTLTIALSVLPLVAIANVGVLIWSLGGINLAARVVAPGLIVLAAALAFVPMLVNSLRFTLWSRFLGLDLGIRGGFKVVTGTMVTNSITPSAAGGMPVKVLFLMGEGVTPRRAATLISLQTAEDMLVLSAMVMICIGFSGFQLVDFLASQPGLLERIEASLVLAGWIGVGLIVGIAGVGGAVFGGLLGDRLRARAVRIAAWVGSVGMQILQDWLAVFQRGKAVALGNLVLTGAQWLARFSLAGIVLAAFGEAWHPALYWLLQYLVQTISSVVPTPGGAGGAEAAFLLLFAPFVAVAVLVPAMSTWRLIAFYLPLAGAALVFFVLHRKTPRLRAQAESAAPGAIPPHSHPAE